MSTIPGAFDVDTLSGMKPLTQVVYSVGSNLGDRLENLQAAVAALRDTPDLMIAAVSPVYETAPVDAPAGSPDFLNIVVVGGDTTQEPLTLLDRAQAIEEAFGRSGPSSTPRAPSMWIWSWSGGAPWTPTGWCCRTRTPISARSC